MTQDVWRFTEVDSADQLSWDHIEDVLTGRTAGLRIGGAIPADRCAEAAHRIRQIGVERYPGMRHDLGTLWPNHWPPRYIDGDYDGYFQSLSDVEDVKAWAFDPLGEHPRTLANGLLRKAGICVRGLVCPDTGRAYHSVIVRAGAAELHCDFGAWDLPDNLAPYVIRQMAWNIYLAAPGGGELEVFRRLGVAPGLTKAEAAARGVSYFGNYDVPADLIADAPVVRIPARTGDFVLINNRHYHRVAPVTPAERTPERLAISSHVAQFTDGIFRDFN